MKITSKQLSWLAGASAKSIYYDSNKHVVVINFSFIEDGKKWEPKLVFYGVSKFYITKEEKWVDKEWDVFVIDQIFYLPDNAGECSFKKEDKKQYNFSVDGEGFEIFLKAKDAELIIEDNL